MSHSFFPSFLFSLLFHFIALQPLLSFVNRPATGRYYMIHFYLGQICLLVGSIKLSIEHVKLPMYNCRFRLQVGPFLHSADKTDSTTPSIHALCSLSSLNRVVKAPLHSTESEVDDSDAHVIISGKVSPKIFVHCK